MASRYTANGTLRLACLSSRSPTVISLLHVTRCGVRSATCCPKSAQYRHRQRSSAVQAEAEAEEEVVAGLAGEVASDSVTAEAVGAVTTEMLSWSTKTTKCQTINSSSRSRR